jgi:tetratricopeptide (TPR) repeat protein
MFYFLARRILSDSLSASLAAFLFGVHPVHVEAVAWVSGASESLAAAPFFGSILCWLRSRESARPTLWRLAALIAYAFALLAKETTIVLPVVLFAYEVVIRRDRALVRRWLAPFTVVMLVYLAARHFALRGTEHTPIPVGVLLLTWPSVLWFYVQHVLVPLNLTLLYGLSLVTEFSWVRVVFPALLVVTFALLVFRYSRTNRVAVFSLMLALVTLLPPLYLRAFSPVELVHDRYLYLPSSGVCLLIALLVRQFRYRFAAILGTSIVLVFSIIAVAESRPWANELALFSRATRISPTSLHARRQLAFALERMGEYEDAMPLLAAILDATPDDHIATFALGACEFHKGKFDEAERMMRSVIALRPAYQQAYLLLATILLGKHQLVEAETVWNQSKAIQIGSLPQPSFHLVHAEILKMHGDLSEAAREYAKELELQPGNPEITAALSNTLALARDRR